ncbi:MAG: hypothetical protein NTW02_01930, partial [Cyanobium sp. LacPavin_0920_WC12_MAG_62_9]|nr:hypothetical protein [Cyanobium sp. LacPavin_0920_WC12_MAG_62_9]
MSWLHRMILFQTTSAAARHGLINTSVPANGWQRKAREGPSLSSKAKVLVISMLGVDQAFQGQMNPSAEDQSY